MGCSQIISASSNLYYANLGNLKSDGSPTMTKRDFAFLSGAITTCFVLIPQYRHLRIFAILALFGSTFVALYMIAESSINGFADANYAASYQ